MVTAIYIGHFFASFTVSLVQGTIFTWECEEIEGLSRANVPDDDHVV